MVMSKYPLLYQWSLEDAIEHDELDKWRESYVANCDCARAIEQGIEENYADNRLNTDFAKDIIEQYGYQRVNWVLAYTIQQKSHDGRINPDHKKWAQDFFMPEDAIQKNIVVGAHPGLTDLFISRVRKEWADLGLFEKAQCTDEKYYEGKLLVLNPFALAEQYRSPEYQLFYASSGFGCDPNAVGTKVCGHFLFDDEYAEFRRARFYGVISEEHIPEWAQEKLKQYQETVEQTDIKME